jgi:guanidinopropionase
MSIRELLITCITLVFPAFLRCKYDTPENADIGIIGVPYSGGNWVERTQYLAPRAIRDLSTGFHRSHRAFKINPFELCRIRDLGFNFYHTIIHCYIVFT